MSTIPVRETTRIARFDHNLHLFVILFYSLFQRKKEAFYRESDLSWSRKWYANRVRDHSRFRVAQVFAFSCSIKGGNGGNYSCDRVFIYGAMEMHFGAVTRVNRMKKSLRPRDFSHSCLDMLIRCNFFCRFRISLIEQTSSFGKCSGRRN